LNSETQFTYTWIFLILILMFIFIIKIIPLSYDDISDMLSKL